MPTTLTYPGVYIEEISSGVHTISGVATSTAAFVGYTASGLDGVAKQIFSFSDYERSFGGLATDSESSYAVQQFFQNGGSRAYVVRVPKTDAKASVLVIQDEVGSDALQFTALSKGTWSNSLLIDIDYEGVPSTDPQAFNLTVTDPASGAVESFPSVSADTSRTNHVEKVVNDPDSGSSVISVSGQGLSGKRPARSGTVGADLTIDPATGIVQGLDASAAGLSIGVACDIPLDPASKPKIGLELQVLEQHEIVPTSLPALCRMLERKLNTAVQGLLPGARFSCLPATTATGIALRVVATIADSLDTVVSFSAGTKAGTKDADVGLRLSTGKPNVAHYWLGTARDKAAGAQSTTKRALGSDGTRLPTGVDLIAGLTALDKVDLFNILCIPDATRAWASNPSKSDPDLVSPSSNDPSGLLAAQNAVFGAALTYCQSRRAFLIIDPPPEVNDVESGTDWIVTKLKVKDSGGSAAAYFPRLKLPDPLNGLKLRAFAPCGVVAGVYARTDSTRGVWKAPAGVEASLTGVQGAVYSLTDDENGALNPLGLNCFRIFPVYGPVSWGARTIAGADAMASEWKYIPIRRLALFIEESLYRGTQWVVFEPNDEPLWGQIRLNLGAFMHSLFVQGAFQGSSPRSAYFVKCDSETTTQDDINRGVVNIVVGFAPLKPAEFVVIRIQQIAGNIQT